MKKEINISGMVYEVEPSMFTMWAYNQNFNRDLYTDFVQLSNTMVDIGNAQDQNKEALEHMGFLIDTALKIAYTMISEENDIGTYEKWLKQIKNLGKNKLWILEVLTALGSVFQGEE